MGSKIKRTRKSTPVLRRSARQRASKPVTKPKSEVSSGDEYEEDLQGDERAQYKCSTCGMSFVYRNKYKIHLKTHAGEGQFKCSICDRSFPSEENLNDHQKWFHKEKIQRCCICNQKCLGYDALLLHMGTHANENSNQNRGTSQSGEIEEEVLFKCSFCEKSYLREQNYNFHMKSHLAKRSHKCPECDKVFPRQGLLRQHQKRLHLKEKNKVCSICDKKFFNSNQLKCHVLTHKEKPYNCEKCPDAFYTSSHLTKHMRLHSKDRRYKCPHCEKRYKTSGTRSQHIKIMHTNVGAYKCNFCEKTFADITQKKNHERTHSGVKPYKCKYCDKTFTTNKWIKKHELNRKVSGVSCYKRIFKETLTVEKSVQSSSNNKKTIASQEIERKDKSTHLKPRPYECSFCEKSFHYQCNRNIHEKNHSVKKPCQRSLVDKNASEMTGSARTRGITPSDKQPKPEIFAKGSSATAGTRIRRVAKFWNRKWFYPCTTCAWNFVTRKQLLSHRKTHKILMPRRVVVLRYA